MQQVPTYAIIGNGRMARHISFYFREIGIPYTAWARKTQGEKSLQDSVKEASHILVLISDGAIEDFIRKHSCLKEKTLIHFSGALVTPLAYGIHPLFTFSDELYSIETYKNIPFVCDLGAPKFSELFPSLPNISYALPPALKSRYHALCVMSNNFTTLLWKKFYSELQETLKMPMNIIHPYLDQTLKNLKNNPSEALTGPLVRNDWKTIDMNLKALENDPFQLIYKAFVENYSKLL